MDECPNDSSNGYGSHNVTRPLPCEVIGCDCVAALRKDAERYRWLKSRQGLTLRSEKQPNLWRRIDGTEFSATHSLAEGGTQHAPADSLDATIDAAMAAR